MNGRNAVIVGGGSVAARKAGGLLEEGARITVVSPSVSPELQKFVNSRQITWKQKAFTPDDVAHAQLIFAATNSKEINLQVKKAAKDGQLVNMADAPAGSDFHLPSSVKRGKLTIAVSTSGASPTLARKIRRELEQKFDETYESTVDFLASCRKRVLAELEDRAVRHQLLAALAEESFYKDPKREDRFKRLLKEAKENE
jgi:precorrin-2 dehydrogenase/sirohydrochlorin ferrochelatase